MRFPRPILALFRVAELQRQSAEVCFSFLFRFLSLHFPFIPPEAAARLVQFAETTSSEC